LQTKSTCKQIQILHVAIKCQNEADPRETWCHSLVRNVQTKLWCYSLCGERMLEHISDFPLYHTLKPCYFYCMTTRLAYMITYLNTANSAHMRIVYLWAWVLALLFVCSHGLVCYLRIHLAAPHVYWANTCDRTQWAWYLTPLFQCWHKLVVCLDIYHTFIQHIHVGDEFYVSIVHTS
jgi:hypothetical protein